MTRRSWFAVAVVSAITQAGAAYADRQEWRVSTTGSGLVVTTDALGSTGEGFAVGGRLRMGYGLLNPLELGFMVSYARAQALRFVGAENAVQRGTLYADLDVMSIGGELRLEPGVETWHLLERVRPFVSARAALRARRLSGLIMLNDQNMILVEPADSVDVRPAWGCSVGLMARLGNSLLLGLVADVLVNAQTTEKALGLEVAWVWY
jgi:hypothetical protein